MTDLHTAAQQALEALDCLDAPASGSIDHYELQRRTDALRSALQTAEHAPNGYAYVPAVATPEMIRAYRSRSPAGNFCDEAYSAMISAAPKPP